MVFCNLEPKVSSLCKDVLFICCENPDIPVGIFRNPGCFSCKLLLLNCCISHGVCNPEQLLRQPSVDTPAVAFLKISKEKVISIALLSRLSSSISGDGEISAALAVTCPDFLFCLPGELPLILSKSSSFEFLLCS